MSSATLAQTLVRPDQLSLEPLATAASLATSAGLVVVLTALLRQRTTHSAPVVVLVATVPAALLLAALTRVPLLRWPLYALAALVVVVVPIYAYSDAIAILTAIDEG